MSGDTSAFGFGKFIPGFDFLQGLAQSAGSAANPMGRVPQWVAPTVSVEEVDKRIAELKAVQFWLDQNGRALSATIQALEVQRMTLSTLKGMNVSMSELAKSFQFPAGVMPGADAAQAAQAAAGFTGWPMGDSAAKEPQAAPEQQAHTPHQPEAAPEPQADAASAAAEDAAASAQQQTQAAMGQAMQWWGALTQQFQQIAAKAMAEPVPAETMAAAQRATEAASGFAKSAMDKVMAQANAFTPSSEPAEAKQTAASSKPKPAAKKAAPKAAAKTAAKPAAKPAAKKPARKATAAARKS